MSAFLAQAQPEYGWEEKVRKMDTATYTKWLVAARTFRSGNYASYGYKDPIPSDLPQDDFPKGNTHP